MQYMDGADVCQEFSVQDTKWFANRMYYREQKLSAGSHFHSYPEVHYITRGEVWVTLDFSQKILLKAGDIWVAGAFVHHEEQIEKSASGYILDLVPVDAQKIENSPLYTGCVVKGNTEVLHLFATLWAEAHGERVAQKECQQACLMLIAAHILRQVNQEAGLRETATNKPKESIMDDFFNHIFDAPAEPCLPQTLAERLHVSVRQMDRLLLRAYGMNFSQKRTQMRVKYVCYRLLNTTHRVEQICEELGLTESYVIRIFKQQQGMTPLQYRKNNTNQT